MLTVAIVGNGRTRDQAPHDNKDLEVWTMNNHAMLWNRRTTAVFEMHPDALVTTRDGYNEEYRVWLRQPHPFPIYMHDPQKEIPASIPYPRAPLEFLYRGARPVRNFYTTTPPYCLALAWYLGFHRVELYGIDLDHEERQAHRDSVFFWIGFLIGRGIEVYIPEECYLFDDYLYPINTPAPPKRVRLFHADNTRRPD
jgi:hypothetical protein